MNTAYEAELSQDVQDILHHPLFADMKTASALSLGTAAFANKAGLQFRVASCCLDWVLALGFFFSQFRAASLSRQGFGIEA